MERYVPPWRWTMWSATFVSLTCLLVQVATSAILLVATLLVWAGIVTLAWPTVSRQLLRDKVIWLLPALALLSVLWSADPGVTLRAAVQLALTTAGALALVAVQPTRSFLSAFMAATGAAVAVGIALGGSSIISYTGEVALTGGYGSKNFFALLIGLNVLLALGVASDREQPGLLRLLGAALVLVDTVFLLRARSLGALLTVAISVGLLAAMLLAGRLSSRERMAGLSLTLLSLAGLTGLFLLLQAEGLLPDVLAAFGKRSDLSGRAMLWDRAQKLIETGNLLGYGYYAFWRQGTPEAEAIWKLAHVPSRMGYTFHNLFYEMAIAFGWLGAAAVGVTLLALTVRTARSALRFPSAQTGTVLAVAVFFVVRAPVEVDIGPWSVASVLIPALYALAARRRVPGVRGAAADARRRKLPWPDAGVPAGSSIQG